MFSGFRALGALLVAASVCSPILSLPTTSPSPLRARALSKRAFGDYIDNLIYLDANKSSIYSAISIGQNTYATALDNQWSGLVVYGDQFTGNTSSTHSITIEEVSVEVQDGREAIGIFEDEVQLEYFHAPQWPSGLPHIGADGVGYAYWGIDINNPMSPIFDYLDAKWPNDYSKWYYDVVLFYDWQNTTTSAEIDFAGIIVAGDIVDWTAILGITASEADQYGLPHLDGITNQSYIWLQGDGTFLIDNTFYAGGQQTTFTSQVAQTPSGNVVADIYFSERWSTFPDPVVKAIYGSVPGAQYVPESTFGYFQIPCDSQLSFAFAINGTQYTVAEDALIAPNPWGSQCIGSIFTKGQAVSAAPEFDVLIGFQLLSSFYYRAGVSPDTNLPYYKLLALPAPTWDGYTSVTYPYNGGQGSSSTYSSASYSSASSYSSAYTGVSAQSTYATSASTYTTTTPSSAPSAGSSSSYSGTADQADSAAATKIAGNLAENSDSSDNSWENKAHLYEIIIIVLGSVLGLGIIGAIIACVVSRRKQKARPSAYRNLHEAETSGTVAPLYGAEGGQSRYADPYQDKE